MSALGYDGKVAIITGAGGGLGRQHALMMASVHGPLCAASSTTKSNGP